MKNRIILLLIIIITATIAACAPTSEAKSDKTEYQNTATTQIHATSTASCTPKPTITPTLTASPTLTSTDEPITLLSELIQNLSPEETEEVLSLMQEQFPGSKENDAYHFFCVGGKLITHEPRIELPTGQEISQTIYCQYYDADGQQRGVHIPIFSYSHQNLDYKMVGYRTNSEPDITDEQWQRITNLFQNAFAMEEVASGNSGPNRLTDLKWSGPGHVIYLNFAMPTAENDFSLWSEDGYFNEALQALMTEDQLEQFAQTGDPSLLPQTASGEPLLLPMNISFKNVFGNIQHRNYEDAKND